MKKIISFITFSLLLLVGCDDNSSILEPADSYTENDLSKGRPILIESSDDLFYSKDDEEIIGDLDESADDFTQSFFNKADGSEELRIVKNVKYLTKHTKNFTVDGAEGGILRVDHKWVNKGGQNQMLSATLFIPKGAYKGLLTFDMIFDLENFALELYPSPFAFDIPLTLDLKFAGIELPSADEINLDFTYLDGTEKMEYGAVEFNPDDKFMSVMKAKLHHFSRYGWTRTRN